MNWTIFFLSLIPAILWIVYFYNQDKYEKEPFRLILWCFILGCLSVIPAIIVELILSRVITYHIAFSPWRLLVEMLMVGLTEEICKYGAVRVGVYKNKEFNEPMDGIVYCVTCAIGFAFVENIGYMMRSQLESGTWGAVSLGIMRALFSMFGHASFGVLMGYFLGKAKFNPDKERVLIWKGVILAALLHTLYNFTLLINREGLGVLLVLPAFVYIWRSMNRVQMDHAEESSPFKPPGSAAPPPHWRWRAANIISAGIIIGTISFATIYFDKPVRFVNQKERYSFTYPSFWQKNKEKDDTVVIMAPAFRNNTAKIKVEMMDSGKGKDPEVELSRVLEELSRKTKGFERIGYEAIVIDGRPAAMAKVRWIKEGEKESGGAMISYIVLASSQERTVRLICTSRADQFEGFGKKFKEVMKSFRFYRN